MKTEHPCRRYRRTNWTPIVAIGVGGVFVGLALAQRTNAVPAPAPDAVVIIVNKANPLETLSTEALRKYLRLEIGQWPDGRKNTVLALPPGAPERAAVLSQIYQCSEADLNRYFLQATYTGQLRSGPKELATAVNVRKFVFNVPGAIGYVRAADVDDSVKVVRIDGRLPGEPGYRLTLPPK